ARLRHRLDLLRAEAEQLAADEIRLTAEHADASVAHAQAAGYLDASGAAGPPLEAARGEAKDAALAAGAEGARLRDTPDPLRGRQDELATRRLRLEEEQRTLGARLHANTQASTAARERAHALQQAVESLRQARHQVDDRQRELAGREAAEAAAHDTARTVLTQ